MRIMEKQTRHTLHQKPTNNPVIKFWIKVNKTRQTPSYMLGINTSLPTSSERLKKMSHI